MPPRRETPEDIIARDEQLFQEHKKVGQEKDNLPDPKEVEKFFQLPSNRGQVAQLRKQYNAGVKDVEKRYRENIREINTFTGNSKRIDIIHETAEAERDNNTLTELREQAFDTYNNPNSSATEIMATRNSYHNEVMSVNDKIWREYKQTVETATEDIESKIRLAEEERDKHRRNRTLYDRKHREVEKLMTKRDNILQKIEQEQKLRLSRAKSFAEQHTDVLEGQARVEVPIQNQPEATNTTNRLLEKKSAKLLIKTVVGAVVGGATALGTVALVGTGSVAIIPGLIGAGVLLSCARGGRIPMLSYMLDRNIAKYRMQIAQLGPDHPERTQKEAILEKRLAASKKLEEYTKIVGISGSFGVVGSAAGLIAGVYSSAAGAGTFAGGGSILAKEAIEEYQTNKRPTINLITELGYTEAELASTTFLNNEQELVINKKLGGKLGKLHGRFHYGVLKQVRKENLNKPIYLAKLQEIATEFATNPNVDVDTKIQEVVAASTVATP